MNTLPNLKCIVTNCKSESKTRGMCKLHYQRWYRTGSTKSTNNKFRGSTVDRYWHYVEKLNDGCWLWTGPNTHNGRENAKVILYPLIFVSETGKFERAHRWAYENFIGPIPEDKPQIDHVCKNSLCVNYEQIDPIHLEPVTNEENSKRSTCANINRARQLAKTHCGVCGDELVWLSTQRGCRTCKNNRERERQRRLRDI